MRCEKSSLVSLFSKPYIATATKKNCKGTAAMRGTFGSWLLLVCWIQTTFGAEFPYSATVAHNNVTARCAPTYNSYSTELLPKGTPVEVHQGVSDGWVAIRPLETAFDWVPAHVVERSAEEPDLGSMKEEFPAFIGSNVKRIDNHLSQVTLKIGETVQILAEKEVANGESEEKWYKIAPPAGEFRWVQVKFLSRQAPEELAEAEEEKLAEKEARYREQNEAEPSGLLGQWKQKTSRERSAASASTIEEIEQRLEARRSREPEATKFGNRFALRGETTAEAAPVAPRYGNRILESPLKSGEKVSLSPEGFSEKQDDPESQRIATAAREQVQAMRSQEFQAQLNALEVDLTQMVAQEPSHWRLAPLKARAQLLITLGPTALERGQARLALEKIAQFEATLPPGFREPDSALATLANATAAGGAKVPPPESYDGTGYLMPVKKAPAGVPPYHLVDADGITRLYVTPLPGMNLDNYIGKQVGVKGKRGYLESLGRQHVLAERVVDMNRAVR
jgi:SH3-like domain-containing protein